MKNENINDLLDKLQYKDKEISDLKLKLDSIQNSRSWRYTAFLRFSGAMARAIKKAAAKPNLILKAVAYYKAHGLANTVDRILTFQKNLSASKPVFLKRPLRITDLENFIRSEGGLLYGVNCINSSKEARYVLLISHEASLTGAPVALKNLAKLLKIKGFFPIFLTPSYGKLIEECVKEGVPSIVLPSLLQNLETHSEFIPLTRNLFDFIVVNTVVSYPCILQLLDTDTPVMWWIHESAESYSETVRNGLPTELSKNIKVYGGGTYAKTMLKKIRPQYEVGELIYPTPEAPNTASGINLDLHKDGRVLFVCAGTIQKRKGQTKLVEAIDSLSPEILSHCLFLFIGKSHDESMLKKIELLTKKLPHNVKRIDEVPHRELLQIYKEMDVLVCPSLDDPLPIVVTDALCRSKLVICSDMVGSASYLKKYEAGIVYDGRDPLALRQAIEKTIYPNASIENLRSNGRKLFNDLFSFEAFDNNFEKILASLKPMEVTNSVSVIIPTYNAGPSFESILQLLRDQKGLSAMEVIIVDSGSKDGTLKLCEKYQAKIIQIENKDFSHSYARNLGASCASNDILLFMTQDAKPGGHNWVSKLIEPLIDEKVAAVSSIEICPDDADLFYKCTSRFFSEYLRSAGPICSLISVNDSASLRKNSSLNDTNCAIKKRVFNFFKYRFDFAEDLDLGIRLIKKGYFLKYDSSNPIVHGHNRNGIYYLKRSFVQTKTLVDLNVYSFDREIIEDLRGNLQLFIRLKKDESLLMQFISPDCQTESVLKRLENYLQSIIDKKTFTSENFLVPVDINEDIIKFVLSINSSIKEEKKISSNVLLWFSYNVLFPLIREKYTEISFSLMQEIIFALRTYCLSLLGEQLAIFDLEKGLPKELESYLTKGV